MVELGFEQALALQTKPFQLDGFGCGRVNNKLVVGGVRVDEHLLQGLIINIVGDTHRVFECAQIDVAALKAVVAKKVGIAHRAGIV